MTPDIIRAWAKSQGLAIGDRGRVSQEIRSLYLESQGPANRPRVRTPTPPPTSATLKQGGRQGAVPKYVPHCRRTKADGTRCKATWTGLSRAHCGGCHLTFNSVGGFDQHQKTGGCVPPSKLGMVLVGGLWRKPDERVWEDAASGAEVDLMVALRASVAAAKCRREDAA